MAGKNEEYHHRYVRLRRELRTRGGDHFPKGSKCWVTSVYRGQLTLAMPNPDPANIFGDQWLSIRCVEVWHVELLPPKVTKPAEKLTCDCGKAELEAEDQIRMEPYAKVVRVASVPAAVKHAAAGCYKVDYLLVPVTRVRSRG